VVVFGEERADVDVDVDVEVCFAGRVEGRFNKRNPTNNRWPREDVAAVGASE
jgi:hypothetical protein